MGSGHFLVEACRFLGERLYEHAGSAMSEPWRPNAVLSRHTDAERNAALIEAAEYRRIQDLPDPTTS
jgi:hypothetical protein